MNRAGDDNTEPTTDAVEAVQPDKDALLIAELKLALREAMGLLYTAVSTQVNEARIDAWIVHRWMLQQHASELLDGDAHEGGKED